jgi:hypothetical protein
VALDGAKRIEAAIYARPDDFTVWFRKFRREFWEELTV